MDEQTRDVLSRRLAGQLSSLAAVIACLFRTRSNTHHYRNIMHAANFRYTAFSTRLFIVKWFSVFSSLSIQLKAELMIVYVTPAILQSESIWCHESSVTVYSASRSCWWFILNSRPSTILVLCSDYWWSWDKFESASRVKDLRCVSYWSTKNTFSMSMKMLVYLTIWLRHKALNIDTQKSIFHSCSFFKTCLHWNSCLSWEYACHLIHLFLFYDWFC